MTAVDFFESVDESYGIEEEGLAVEDEEGVPVPENRINLTDQQTTDLAQSVNPLRESDNFGIDIYEDTLHFLRNSLAF